MPPWPVMIILFGENDRIVFFVHDIIKSLPEIHIVIFGLDFFFFGDGTAF